MPDVTPLGPHGSWLLCHTECVCVAVQCVSNPSFGWDCDHKSVIYLESTSSRRSVDIEEFSLYVLYVVVLFGVLYDGTTC